MTEKDNKDLQCPVCGYYCLGKGGRGCIDKPSIVGVDRDKDLTSLNRLMASPPGLRINYV